MAKIGLDLIQKDFDAIDLSSENVNKFLQPKLSFDFAQEISDYANSCTIFQMDCWLIWGIYALQVKLALSWS